MANRTYSSPADEGRKTFSDNEIQKVWNKAKKIDGEDASLYRKDYAGAWIKRDEYGLHSDGRSTIANLWQMAVLMI